MNDALSFEWDAAKNKSNIAKHHISFDEAQTVFFDPDARVIDDLEHSAEEERFIILGLSRTPRLLVVCHCCRTTKQTIRIVSARKATKTEAKQYVAYLKGR